MVHVSTPYRATLHIVLFIIPECSEGTATVNRKGVAMAMAMVVMELYFTLYFVKRGTTFFSRTPLVAMVYIVSWLPCGCITVVKS